MNFPENDIEYRSQVSRAHGVLTNKDFEEVVMTQIGYKREEFIRKGKSAIERGKTEKAAYYMAVVAGVDGIVEIFDEYKREYEKLRRIAAEEKDDAKTNE